MNTHHVAVIGAGLAGCECALYLSRKGIAVTLFEQKPDTMSAAHNSPHLGELVCSNSLRSDDLHSGVGLLKEELRQLGSRFMYCAEATRVPAGKALAVDRERFALAMTREVEASPGITLVRRAIHSLEDDALAGFDRVVLAAGPMMSEGLCESLAATLGQGNLYFYDAIAPIISGDSLDMSIVFSGSRYGEPGEEGDYLNCPMSKDEYTRFYEALVQGEKVRPHGFEEEKHFEGCMPIEALAERGDRTLTFGPLKPVGFVDPRTGRRPYALLQLRPENLNRTMFNLVGCQTKLTYQAQENVFRTVPGLERAVFVRHGSMHRNTYVNAPQVLDARMGLKVRPKIKLAGQITGVEGYVESAASGIWTAMIVEAELKGLTLADPPPGTATGSLIRHLRTHAKVFQPSNINFGLMPPPEESLKKTERKKYYAERAMNLFESWKNTLA